MNNLNTTHSQTPTPKPNSNLEGNISFKSIIWDWTKTIVLAFVFSFIVSLFVKPTLVSGISMYPTLQHNNLLLINRIETKTNLPTYGDIIVFNSHLAVEKVLIKRVIAVEGDKIVIADGKVYVNDKQIDEPYIFQEYPATKGSIALIVPKNKVFVMGDNRANSFDSRSDTIGTIDKSEIIGKVFMRVFPFSKIPEYNFK